MKRTNNPTAYVLAIASAALLAGCGGGGGGGSSTINQLTISGAVFRSDGKTPLSGATVAFDGSAGPSTITNVSGVYSLAVPGTVSIGAHNLVIEFPSGGTLAPIYAQQIQVNSQTETGVNVTVPSTSPPPPP